MKQRSLHFLAVLTALLLPVCAWANIWQDPESKVNYEYTPGGSQASVKGGQYGELAGSPEVQGDVAILPSISVNGKEYKVTSIRDWAFFWCTDITSVTIPNSVISIGRNAFEGCSSLTSIIIPNSVTSIGNYAFDSCSGLTSIIVESGNSVYDSRNNCNALIHTATNKLIKGCENTVIPNTVTTIEEGAFDRCYGLNSITIPNSVESIGVGTFAGCNSLTSIIVESGNTVYDSRDNCNAIIHTASHELIAGCKNTVIPNSVTSIGVGAFSDCRDLTSITIPNSVTSIGLGAFGGCNSLTSVNFGNSLTTIGTAAFFTCDGLTSVTIPNSVITIGEDAFWDCNDLISVTIPNSVTSIGEYNQEIMGKTNVEIIPVIA